MSSLALSFHDVNFNPVAQADHQIWLTSRELGQALGYAREDSVNKIYERNIDEFTEQMTCNVKLTLQDQARETRIFSLRGAHLIAMLARTPIAKAFRKWVLDILDKQTTAQTSPDITETLSQTLNQLSNGNKKLYMSMYNGLTRHFKIHRLSDITAQQFTQAITLVLQFAQAWNNKNSTPKLNDGQHYIVAKDGVAIYQKVLSTDCGNITPKMLGNQQLLLEHIKQVVGEFIGKDALPAPQPILDIHYPAISARPKNTFLPNQHWYKANDFVSGNFDPVKDFLDKLEKAGYEVTGLKIINNAKTWVIQQQDKALKHIERGHRQISEGLKLYNDYGMCVTGFTMGKVSY